MATRLKKKYQYAVIATDVVIFTIVENELKVLLIKMKKHPYERCWAIPGGLVKSDESVDNAARRQLLEKTALKNVYLEQLYTFGEVDRDPFGRVVSVAYFALIPADGLKLKTSEEYESVEWASVNDLPRLAYDHKNIVNTAIERLRSKLEYTNVVYSLMPEFFSLSDLQKTYEIILNKKFDKRNFRKKLLSLDIVKQTRQTTIGEAHRPAILYQFKERKPRVVDIL
jgi:8-oxo-dGTP diphosphatase